tara:strand:- start:107 stop:922 length:816 start_codon:yes stop_codon:yes gene_type:complete
MSIPKIVFIIPYKNRSEEKLHFSIYMKYILEDYNDDDYQIYYSHQIENKPFSRGGTKNIGFLAIKDKYPDDYKNITFVFNDIDTVPCEKNMLNYITTKGIVKHFFGFTFTLGGIFSIIGEDFEICNGFPNLYGWGMEDNAIYQRTKTNNIKIDRSVFYPIRSRKIINFNNDSKRIINNKDPSDYNRKNFIDNLDTINNLEYTIVSNKENSLKNNSKEFMININKFTSLVNPLNQEYYIQDTSLTSKVYPNVLQRQRSREQWSMKRLMGTGR